MKLTRPQIKVLQQARDTGPIFSKGIYKPGNGYLAEDGSTIHGRTIGALYRKVLLRYPFEIGEAYPGEAEDGRTALVITSAGRAALLQHELEQ